MDITLDKISILFQMNWCWLQSYNRFWQVKKLHNPNHNRICILQARAPISGSLHLKFTKLWNWAAAAASYSFICSIFTQLTSSLFLSPLYNSACNRNQNRQKKTVMHMKGLDFKKGQIYLPKAGHIMLWKQTMFVVLGLGSVCAFFGQV